MKRYLVLLVLNLVFWTPLTYGADGGVLILGGTGQLGSEVVKDLVAAGEDVTVLARPTSNRERLAGLDVTYVIGDMLVESDMERVFRETSYRAVVDASSQAFGGSQTFYEESQQIISKWAAATGVGQMILHGAIGAGDSADLLYLEKSHPVQQTAIASKTIAEQILIDSGVPYTIIRHLTLLPMTMKESGKARLTRDLTDLGAMTRDGLARLTLECLDNTDCMNVIFHAADDDVDLSDSLIERWKRVIKPEYLPSYVTAGS